MDEHSVMADAPQQVEAHHTDGIKETIESIVVALILAFVFRAFVVEAFVIPTGSMAPTLYGAHGTIVCEDCGTEFAYGLKDLNDSRNATLVSSDAGAVCPNCNYANRSLRINDVERNPETGDRILVLKWPFDLGGDLLGPARWDVVVFKDPSDGETNFIKRLIGLPNEVLMIIDGDVYTVPTSELSKNALAKLGQLRQRKYLFRTGKMHGNLPEIPKELRDELDRKVRIARKTPQAQQALWFLVYDHDYPPRTRGPGQPAWSAFRREQSGWDTSNRRIRFFDRDIEDDYIELTGRPILATCSYNVHKRTVPPPVSDQRVRFVFTPLTSDGSLKVSLTKARRSFLATIQVDGQVAITESHRGERPPPLAMATQLPPFVPGKSVQIAFENVDYRLALYVGGREVLATSPDPNDEAYYGPNVRQLRTDGHPQSAAPPRVYGEGGRFELTHLAVDRDVYYYHDPRSGALALPWAPREGWGSPQSPIMLRGHEYFMLGDNTAASKDSRLWDNVDPRFDSRKEAFQLGTVPEDQLIGKAFFVYWPSPNRVSWLGWLPVLKGAVIPDVGRMRWIR